MESEASALQLERREERRIVAPYRDRLEFRIISEFLVSYALWITVFIVGLNGSLPLWVGFLLSAAISATFYMPLHEATHGNIWGSHKRGRFLEDFIGYASSGPLAVEYWSHRASHMRHHAYTNDPDRDPDFFIQGPLREVPLVWYSTVLIHTLLPLFIFVPPARRLLPKKARKENTRRLDSTVSESSSEKTPATADASKQLQEGKKELRYWGITTSLLLVAFIFGKGLEVFLLWYLPARLGVCWLALVFAWFPHHPAEKTGRYLDTREAVFPGSTYLIRGHDYHALHHLFPRVPHYRLPKLWEVIGPEMTRKGVRTEGRAKGSTGPIIW